MKCAALSSVFTVLLFSQAYFRNKQKNQSVESAGLAFVKGAKCKEYIYIYIYMRDEQAQTNKPKDVQVHGRTDFGMNTVR